MEITNAVTTALKGEPDIQARIKKLIAAHMLTILESPDFHKTSLELNWRALSEDRRQEVIEARAAYEALVRGRSRRHRRAVISARTPFPGSWRGYS